LYIFREYQSVRSLGIPLSGGNDMVAQIAYAAMPRMHFTGAMNKCYERSPYRCSGVSGSLATHDNCTSFYSLAGMPGGSNATASATGDEKSKRWMKAMSCEAMSSVKARVRPLAATAALSVTDSPYADVFSPVSASVSSSGVGQKRSREAVAGGERRPPPPLPPGTLGAAPPAGTTSFFFGETRGGGRKSKQPNAVNLVAPSEDATMLFIGGIPPMPADAAEDLLLPLFPGGVTVKGVDNKPFAFVDFPSHESAKAALNSHNSGGNILSLPKDIGGGAPLSVGWGKAKGTDGGGGDRGWDRPIVRPTQPRVEHINASHSDDCWFCLASPVVKVHLVVSVSESAYLSLPRGGMSALHVLAVPIECVPNRLQASAAALKDLDKYSDAVADMYQSINCRMLCYERAIRTKGKDHMQLHLVPVPNDMVAQAVPTFFEICSKFNLKFQEIMGDATVQETVKQIASHIAYPEYFYISLPVGQSQSQVKRFIYVHEPNSYFKMHFGSEVAANVIGKPDRANWKNCAQEEPQEIELATKFRASFEKFDFSLS
jgi:hypothetical protein